MYDILYFFIDSPATFTLFKYHFAAVHVMNKVYKL